MGPFSTNTPQHSPSSSTGSKLPVPDIEGPSPNVIVSVAPDHDGLKRWLNITLIIVAAMAVVGVAAFAVTNYLNNTPSSLLNSAFQNLVISDSEAGTITYQASQNATDTIKGDFLFYKDPANPHTGTMTINAGQDVSRVSTTLRFFTDGNYFQVAGLGNLGRLVGALHGDTSTLTPDNLIQLSSLDGQWYSLTSDDIPQTNTILPQHTVQAAPNSSDIETLGQTYVKFPFFTAIQQLSDEPINDVKSMHLKIGIDPIKLQHFLQALKAAQLKSIHLTDPDIQFLLNVAAHPSVSLEAWISRSDRAFDQILVSWGSQTLTLTSVPDQAAAQVQSIPRPTGPQSAADFIHSIHDVLTSPSAH